MGGVSGSMPSPGSALRHGSRNSRGGAVPGRKCRRPRSWSSADRGPSADRPGSSGRRSAGPRCRPRGREPDPARQHDPAEVGRGPDIAVARTDRPYPRNADRERRGTGPGGPGRPHVNGQRLGFRHPERMRPSSSVCPSSSSVKWMGRIVPPRPCPRTGTGYPAAGLPPGVTTWPVYSTPLSIVIVVKNGSSPLACPRMISASRTCRDFLAMNSGCLIRSMIVSRRSATCSGGKLSRNRPSASVRIVSRRPRRECPRVRARIERSTITVAPFTGLPVSTSTTRPGNVRRRHRLRILGRSPMAGESNPTRTTDRAHRRADRSRGVSGPLEAIGCPLSDFPMARTPGCPCRTDPLFRSVSYRRRRAAIPHQRWGEGPQLE